MNNREIKDKARVYYRNNKSQIVKACIWFYVSIIAILFLLFVVSYKFLGDYLEDYTIVFFGVFTLLVSPLYIGFNKALRNVTIEQKLFNSSDLFYFYNPRCVLSVMASMVIIIAIMYLGSVTSLVLYVVYFFTLGLLQYILADLSAEEIPYKNCFKESLNLLKGHRIEYFGLVISFIWQIILTVITFGLAIFYTLPVIKISKIIYFENIDGDEMVIHKF